MWALIPARIQAWLAAAGAVLVAIGAAWLSGRRSGGEAVRQRQLEDTVNAQQQMDRAGADYRGDGGASKRLRDGTF